MDEGKIRELNKSGEIVQELNQVTREETEHLKVLDVCGERSEKSEDSMCSVGNTCAEVVEKSEDEVDENSDLPLYKVKCHSCDCRFIEAKYLVMHEENFHKKVFCCHYCCSTFSTPDLLRAHCEKMHVGLHVGPSRVEAPKTVFENMERSSQERDTNEASEKINCTEETPSSSVCSAKKVLGKNNKNMNVRATEGVESPLTVVEDVDMATTSDQDKVETSDSIRIVKDPNISNVSRNLADNYGDLKDTQTINSEKAEEQCTWKGNSVAENKANKGEGDSLDSADIGVVASISLKASEVSSNGETYASETHVEQSLKQYKSRECLLLSDVRATQQKSSIRNQERCWSLPPYAAASRYEDCRRRANSECDLNIFDFESCDNQFIDLHGCSEAVCSPFSHSSEDNESKALSSVKPESELLTGKSDGVSEENLEYTTLRNCTENSLNPVNGRSIPRVFLVRNENGEEDVFVEDKQTNGEESSDFSNLIYYFRFKNQSGVACVEGKTFLADKGESEHDEPVEGLNNSSKQDDFCEEFSKKTINCRRKRPMKCNETVTPIKKKSRRQRMNEYKASVRRKRIGK
uniref:C2H2-type domain-containing protein n=1 Tax=Syphacia muris TaxID=451379 RepID=A0A0N5ATB7_9BILA